MSPWTQKAHNAGRRLAKEAFEDSDNPPPYPAVRDIIGWMHEFVPSQLHAGTVEGEIKSAFIEGYREVYISKSRRRKKSSGGSVVTMNDIKLAKKLGSLT